MDVLCHGTGHWAREVIIIAFVIVCIIPNLFNVLQIYSVYIACLQSIWLKMRLNVIDAVVSVICLDSVRHQVNINAHKHIRLSIFVENSSDIGKEGFITRRDGISTGPTGPLFTSMTFWSLKWLHLIKYSLCRPEYVSSCNPASSVENIEEDELMSDCSMSIILLNLLVKKIWLKSVSKPTNNYNDNKVKHTIPKYSFISFIYKNFHNQFRTLLRRLRKLFNGILVLSNVHYRYTWNLSNTIL